MIFGAVFWVGKLTLKGFALAAVFLVAAAIAGYVIHRDLSVRGWRSVLE